MEVRRFARIKKVIWDQLLATKAEIIQRKLYFRFACIFLAHLTKVIDIAWHIHDRMLRFFFET